MRGSLTALCLAVLAASLAGCGGDDSEDATSPEAPAVAEADSLAEPPPRGASPLLKEIYRQFQPPEPDPAVKGSAKAIKAGEARCKGKTPLQIREEFIAGSDLSEDQAKIVAQLRRYERKPSPSFPAGQLGALVYQQTLPERTAGYGYQGCVYALSLRLKRELAP